MPRRALAYTLTLFLLAALAGFGTAAPARAQDGGGKLLMVLDSSGSMAEPTDSGQPKIDAAKAALTDVAGSLDPSSQVGMRVYGATVFDRSDAGACTDSQLVVPIGAGNSEALKAEIAKYKPYGETPIAYALEQAGNDLGPSGQRSILLVSDGEETCAPDPCPAAEKLAAQGIDLRIDVIGFKVSDTARSQLSCIAEKGRGEYSDADNAEELKKKVTEAKDRAVRPFETTGTPVQGTPDPAAAPQIAVGSWTDKMPEPGSSVHYKITRQQPGSTVWIGMNSINSAGSSLVTMELTAVDGSAECGREATAGYEAGETASNLFSAMVSTATEDGEGCEGDLLLQIARKDGAGGGNFQLDVSEEPPVPDPSGLPEKAGEPTWQPLEIGPDATPITGAQSLAAAPTVTAGQTHRLEIVPGELQVLKVKADWGQQVQVRGLTQGGEEYQRTRHLLRTRVLSPWGGPANTSAKDVPGSSATSAANGRVATTTPQIRYRNREDRFNKESLGTSVAGEYYVVFALDKKDVTTPVPLTFVVDTPGTAGEGAPTYEGEVAPEDPNSEQQNKPEPPGGEQTDDRSANSPWKWAGVGVGAIAGLALIGAAIWLVVRRRG